MSPLPQCVLHALSRGDGLLHLVLGLHGGYAEPRAQSNQDDQHNAHADQDATDTAATLDPTDMLRTHPATMTPRVAGWSDAAD